jgi:hypothetical protein
MGYRLLGGERKKRFDFLFFYDFVIIFFATIHCAVERYHFFFVVCIVNSSFQLKQDIRNTSNATKEIMCVSTNQRN